MNKTLIQHEKKTKLKNILRLESSSFLTLLIFVYFIIELSLKVKSNLISIGFLIASIKQLSSFLNIIRWDLYSVLEIKSELSNYLKDFNEFESFNEIDNNESIFIDKIKSLNIKNLNFIYPFSKKVILHDINYDFKLNKSYAIVGENGCGKTTFIKLLLGLYKNYSGEILLNDKELKTLTPKSISENFAVVFQDYGRYYLNLIENIQIGNPKASISEIQNAISLFSLNGIDKESVLRKGDDKSVNLSGGQWQNIAMARNFISNAKIVIFDEPTAALSPSQESKIYTFLKDIIKNKTAVFISHRLGITPLVDKIIVLKDGVIAETGSHNDLIQKKGIYAQMYNTQKELYS
ncbi:ATP-binding cassette domain-containing protein [Treponema putidum]|uniref:ATP-binding cassette domain-containing protein n=1 Tax=Treponema putidum TaxID=221027 RepID=UPI001199B9FE|nr:ATP-binding cassette subfamily B protein [Treponema putidum]